MNNALHSAGKKKKSAIVDAIAYFNVGIFYCDKRNLVN